MTATIEITPVKNSNIKETINIPKSLHRLKDNECANGRHVFRILTPKDGDVRVVWDARDLGQIQDAKVMFDDCIAKGLVPYRVGVDGKATSDVMDEFDPNSEEIIFLPIGQVAGG
jgi:hypothetical protein